MPKYTRDDIIKGLKNPRLVSREFERISRHAIHFPRRVAFQYRYNYDYDIMNADWDNLIILDACRYDIIKNMGLFENVEYKILDSSNSLEFVENYISNNTHNDAVYVTANPFGAQVYPSTFYKKIITFNYQEGNKKAQVQNLEESWSQGWSPETVYQVAKDAFKNNPNKRMIIHFMQPHGPYFGSKAKQARERLRSEGFKFWAWNEEINKKDKSNNDYILSHLLPAAQRGLIKKDEFIEIYKENLEYVSAYVEKIFDEFDGKTVVTSDHGEMLGESKIFLPDNMGGMGKSIGHGYGIYTKELRKVPWIINNYTERRNISQEESEKNMDNEVNDIEDQLRALGYK